MSVAITGRARAASLSLSLGALLALCLPAAAEETIRIVRVDEEWELVVTEPDVGSSGPQVTCVIAPNGVAEGEFATLELNHATAPEFKPGGVHLQAWSGETNQGTQTAGSFRSLATQGETITWKQGMLLAEGKLIYAVWDGHSTTWGNFGALRLSRDSSLQSLNNYSPEKTAKLSGIGFASNRVGRLVLKKVKVWTDSGVSGEDATPRVVYAAP